MCSATLIIAVYHRIPIPIVGALSKVSLAWKPRTGSFRQIFSRVCWLIPWRMNSRSGFIFHPVVFSPPTDARRLGQPFPVREFKIYLFETRRQGGAYSIPWCSNPFARLTGLYALRGKCYTPLNEERGQDGEAEDPGHHFRPGSLDDNRATSLPSGDWTITTRESPMLTPSERTSNSYSHQSRLLAKGVGLAIRPWITGTQVGHPFHRNRVSKHIQRSPTP